MGWKWLKLDGGRTQGPFVGSGEAVLLTTSTLIQATIQVGNGSVARQRGGQDKCSKRSRGR